MGLRRNTHTTGRQALSPSAGQGPELFFGRTCRPGLPAMVLAVLVFFLAALAATTPCRAAESFVNQARLTWGGGGSASAAASVLKIDPTTSALALMQYAPAMPGAQMVLVSPTAYSGDGSESVSGQPMGAIYPSGSTTPIDISNPIPLADARVYHQGDPVFIRLDDGDQNRDPAVQETLWVRADTDVNGDSELLLLRETDVDSGVFIGYVQTSGERTPAAQNGVLDVADQDTVTVTYTDSNDSNDIAVSTGLVDPLGLVFNSLTGEPVDGVSLTLINADTNQPAAVFGDDGVSPFPSTIVSGATVTDDAGKLYTFASGRFRFPFVAPGTYRLVAAPPAGYAAPSAVSTTDLLGLPGAPFVIVEPGSRGEDFVLHLGPALRMDVPVDPIHQGLWLRKTVNLNTAAIGDFLQYTVTLERSVDAPGSRITLHDRLPAGFRYRAGSARLNGQPTQEPAVADDGRSLTFDLGDLGGETQSEVRYAVVIGAGTPLGDADNVARAEGTGGLYSNSATARVKVEEDLFRSRNFITGRVIVDNCGDRPPGVGDGVPGVRIFLEDGTYTVTDEQGRYHFTGLSSGTHVVQLDFDGLAEKYDVFPCEDNTRFAGSAFSQFVALNGGTLWQADFHLILKPKATGNVRLTLGTRLVDDHRMEYTATLEGATVPVHHMELVVALPGGVRYRSDSCHHDDVAGGEPDVAEAAAVNAMDAEDAGASVTGGQTLRFHLGDQDAGFRHRLTFSAALDPDGPGAELATRAWLVFDTPETKGQSTPPVENIIRRSHSKDHVRQPNLVLRANFDVLAADLNDHQKEQLDPLLSQAGGDEIVHVLVKGYSDNLPISNRSRHVYVDNFDLSRARAQSVVDYLSQKLGLEPDQITLVGMGPDEPVADNDSDQGRAANRRVHVDVIREKTVVEDHVEVSKASDRGRADTTGLRPGETWSDPVSEAQAPTAAQAPTVADATPAATVSGAHARPTNGILSPADQALLVTPIAAVRILLDSRLTPRLTLDGQDVPKEKIGFRAADPKTGSTLYTFIGVDFGAPGAHTLTLSGLGPFGNARFTRTHTIIRTGEITAIRQVSTKNDGKGNVADGRTPVMVAIELLDSAGRSIHAPVALELREGNLRPPTPEKAAGLSTIPDNRVQVDENGRIYFQPVTQSGRYRATLAYNDRTVTVETYVQPKLRDWILVGLAEGTMGYNTVTGNMENLSAAEQKDDFYQNGRLAFFAKGKVKGRWLITMAYDSQGEKQGPDRRLFQTVDPDAYYSLYGDAAEQQAEASSLRRLYLKIERDQFYALFGDYHTDLTITELSRYNRSFNGLKAEYHDDRFDASVFAADTHQAFVKDEIQGDGTSGLYHLSRRQLVLNSEKVTLETRDRFHGDTVLDSRALTRYVDYSIDYDAGTLFFKSPVFSQDENLNPIFIVVDYEAEDIGDTGYTYGGRGAVKLLGGRMETGATYIHEGPVRAEGDLAGMDTRLDLGHGVEAKAEVAATERQEGGETIRGQAYLAQVAQTTPTHDLRIYYREQSQGFGLGQQNGSEDETRKYGMDGSWRFKENWALTGEVFHGDQLADGSRRLMVHTGLSFKKTDYTLSLGIRVVEDQAGDGTNERSDQITAGVSKSFFNNRLKLRLTHEQSVGGNNDSDDFPTRTIIGADYQLTDQAALFAEHEFTFKPERQDQSDRVGLKTTPWGGGRLSSSLGRRFTEDEDRLFANLGLAQTWRITERWRVDAGADRSQTLSNNDPPAGGESAAGEDFTAVTTSIGYDTGIWSWVARLESRWAEQRSKWGLVSGVAGQVRSDLGLSIGGQLFREVVREGADTLKGDLKLSAAWRPLHGRWILLDRLEYKTEQQCDSAGETLGQRIVNNFNANFRPLRRLQLAVQYGAKYTFDTIDRDGYTGYTDLTGLETRYDITPRWDIGLHLGFLHTWHAGQTEYRTGLSVGYALFKNAWVSLGYNFNGFQDEDFSAADYTTRGPFVKFRLKVDQQSLKEMVSWFDRKVNVE